MSTWNKLRPEYDRLWSQMRIRPDKQATLVAVARKIIASKAVYKGVERATTVPWYVVGIIHAMEAGLSFTKHLHNGDPLKRRTVQVPAGRPKAEPKGGWSAGYSWEESAIDAIRYDGLDRVGDWSVERIAYELEGYNGWGYRKHHPEVKTPYLWSYTTVYKKGKYVKDGVWDANAVSGQAGAMAILYTLSTLDSEVRPTDLPSGGSVPTADTSPALVRAIQERLLELNYPVGGVDGDFGNMTRDAVVAYQMDSGLPTDPRATEELLRHLLTEGKPRPVSAERQAATEPPGAAVEKAIETAGKITVGVSGVAGAATTAEKSGALDKLNDSVGSLTTLSSGLKTIIANLGQYWWVGALGLGVFVAYKAWKARQRRLERFRTGQET
jgi:lysozyme family protein